MNVFGIIKYAFSILYRKKSIFFIQIFMIIVSVCMLNQVFTGYYNTNAGIISLLNNLDTDKKNTYKISFGNITNMSEDNGKNIFLFADRLSEIEGVDISGKYYIEGLSFLCTETVDFAEIGAEVYCIDETLMNMHCIKDIDNNIIKLKESEYKELAVGYNLKDYMPVGSIWVEPYYGDKYVVTSIIRKGETAMSTAIIQDATNEKCLDDMLYTLSNDNSFLIDGYFTAFTFANNVFFTLNGDNPEEAIEKIEEMGLELNCPVNIKSIDTIINEYKDSYKEAYRIINYQVIMIVAISFIGLFITMIINLEDQKNNMWVMHIYGVRIKEYVAIHIVNQILTTVLSCCVAYLISCKLIKYYYNADYVGIVMPYSILFVNIMIALIEVYAAYFINNRLKSMFREEN